MGTASWIPRITLAMVLLLVSPSAHGFFPHGKFGPGRSRLAEIFRSHFHKARFAGKNLGEISNSNGSKSSEETRNWVNALNEMISESGNEIRVMFEEGAIDQETYEDVLTQLAQEEEQAFGSAEVMRAIFNQPYVAPVEIPQESVQIPQRDPANQTVYEDSEFAGFPTFPLSESQSSNESAGIAVTADVLQPASPTPSILPAAATQTARLSMLVVDASAATPQVSGFRAPAKMPNAPATQGRSVRVSYAGSGTSRGEVSDSESLSRDASKTRVPSSMREGSPATIGTSPSAVAKSAPKGVFAKVLTSIDDLGSFVARGTARATTDLGNWLREATGHAPSRSFLLPNSSGLREEDEAEAFWWGVSALSLLFAAFAGTLLWVYRKLKREQARNEFQTILPSRTQDFQIRLKMINGKQRAVVEVADLTTRKVLDTKRLVDGSVVLARNLAPELALTARVESGLDRVRYSPDGRFERTNAEPKIVVYAHKTAV